MKRLALAGVHLGDPDRHWRARQESNLYQELRKLSFYPLNYGRRVVIVACLRENFSKPENKRGNTVPRPPRTHPCIETVV